MTNKKTAFDLDPKLNVGDPSGADAFTLAATEALVASNADLDPNDAALEVAAKKFSFLAKFPEFFPYLDRELDTHRNLALLYQLPEKHYEIVRGWYNIDTDKVASAAKVRDHPASPPQAEIKTFDLARYHLSESGCYYDFETGELMGYRGPNHEFLPLDIKFGEAYKVVTDIKPKEKVEEFRLDTEDKVKWALKRLLRIDTKLKALDIEQQMILDNIERQRKKLTNERKGFMWKFAYDLEQYYNKAKSKGKSLNLTYGVLKKSMKPASMKINQRQSSAAVLYIESRIEELVCIYKATTDTYEQEAIWTMIAAYESALKVETSVLVSKIPDLDKYLGLLPSDIFNVTDKHEEFSVEIKVSDADTTYVAVIPD